MQENNFELKIEKMIYGGNAMGKIDGFPYFAEGGCPDDVVNVNLIKKNKSYAIAKINTIKTPSDKRVKPFCPMHNVCGSCDWQYIDYEEQLLQKQNIVKETIKKFYGEDLTVLPVKHARTDREYRHKVQYPVSQTKVSKRIIAGYFKKGTHEPVNIKFCPVQPKILDELTEFIRETAKNLNISGYDEKKHTGILRHIIYRMSHYNQKVLVTLVLNDQKVCDKIKKLADLIFEKDYIAGVCVNFNDKKTNVITNGKSIPLKGDDFIIEKINEISYKVSADSFFQVNPEAAEIMFSTAKRMIEENVQNPTILDAYSGVSAFGLQMKDIAKEIVCVEENSSSAQDAILNIELNQAKNITVINDDAAKTFEKFVSDNRKFDAVLLDPPRKGCSQNSLDFATQLAEKIIVYVSCNPSSLARDLKYLKEKGFTAKYAQPVDMFCHTSHIENVVLIEKD